MSHDRPLTPLEFYAVRCSISYGEVWMTPDRLAAILRDGAEPTDSERAQLLQGLTETPATSLNRNSAQDLAEALGVTLDQLDARCRALCYGKGMGESAFSVLEQLIEIGIIARFGNDPTGQKAVRKLVTEELRARGWSLPLYTSQDG